MLNTAYTSSPLSPGGVSGDTDLTHLTDLAYLRAKHVVTEDIRTLNTVTALKNGNFKQVGEYMTLSHYSLSKDYEVSCVELDILVELALQVKGVYGSRMTGGGFGGCTVTLVEKAAAESLMIYLHIEYLKRTGNICECFIAEPSQGSGVIILTSESDTEPTPAVQAKGEEVEKVDGISVAITKALNWMVPLSVLALALTVAILSRRK